MARATSVCDPQHLRTSKGSGIIQRFSARAKLLRLTESRSASASTGLCPKAQGCRNTATLGNRSTTVQPHPCVGSIWPIREAGQFREFAAHQNFATELEQNRTTCGNEALPPNCGLKLGSSTVGVSLSSIVNTASVGLPSTAPSLGLLKVNRTVSLPSTDGSSRIGILNDFVSSCGANWIVPLCAA